MTLLDALRVAHSFLKAEPAMEDVALSLREARERLREEMERADKRYGLAKETPANLDGMPLLIHGAIHEVLRRINHGPDPAPRVPQPESPKSPDPVIDEVCEYIRAGYPMNSNHEWREDLIRRLRAASRRDTP